MLPVGPRLTTEPTAGEGGEASKGKARRGTPAQMWCRRVLCPSGLLKKDLQEEDSEVLTTSSQISVRAIRKHVLGEERTAWAVS